MQQRQRLIESTNKGFGHLGDEPPCPLLPHAIEDRLIQVLDDCIVGPNPGTLTVNVKPFQEFLRVYGDRAGWNQTNKHLCLSSAQDAENTILFTTARLKRMQHRAEWAINILLQRGLPHGMIPEGTDYLGR